MFGGLGPAKKEKLVRHPLKHGLFTTCYLSSGLGGFRPQ